MRRADASAALQERTIAAVARVSDLARAGQRDLFPIVKFTALSQKGRGEKPQLMLAVLGRFLAVELDAVREGGADGADVKAFAVSSTSFRRKSHRAE